MLKNLKDVGAPGRNYLWCLENMNFTFVLVFIKNNSNFFISVLALLLNSCLCIAIFFTL
jgi:hypothetical protein